MNAIEYALRELETAKVDLQRDKYLIPVALLVTPEGLEDFNLDFGDSEQKKQVYEELVKIAKQKRALAMITINDTNITDHPITKSEHANDPKQQSTSQECIFVTVSGPSMRTWSLSLPYIRSANEILFGDPIESWGDILNLLPNWPSDKPAPS
jgi:hypothetical protein